MSQQPTSSFSMRTLLIGCCGLAGAFALGFLLSQSSLVRASEAQSKGDVIAMTDSNQPVDAACAGACSLPINDEELRRILSPEQYRVVRQNGTERPFANAYWNNKEEGLYVDIVGGRPLFSSREKFDSGTGWPSFTKPVDANEIVEVVDRSHGMVRTEVRSRTADSHLGHLFNDGPRPTGLRYCINSASLRFIPVDRLEQEGYAEWLPHFGREATGKQDEAVAVQTAQAMFGAGCFWGVESYFRRLDGVIDTAVGYAGGHKDEPTYREVCTGRTGHAEVIHITFDPSKISFEELLRHFYKMHDPTQLNRQGPDVGTQYRSAVFYYDEEQAKVAQRVQAELDASGIFRRPIVTQIAKADTFWRAEEYHQRYNEKNGRESCHF